MRLRAAASRPPSPRRLAAGIAAAGLLLLYLAVLRAHSAWALHVRDSLLPTSVLPPLPPQPTIYVACLALQGVVHGLEAQGFLASHQESNASVIVPCNSRSLAPVLVQKYLGRKLITNIIGVVARYCLGSQKTEQLACRTELAKMNGCGDYNSLGYQPAQYALPGECSEMLKVAKPLVIKPADGLHGMGIEFWAKPPSLEHCLAQRYAIGQVYVDNPALLSGGVKFDLRTWVLVAHIDPLIVFHADGFARVAARAFTLNDTDPLIHITNAHGQEDNMGHFRTFESLRAELAAAYGWPADYFSTKFRAQTDRAVRMAVLAQFKTTFGAFSDKPRLGIMHLLAADWCLDATGKVHLLELNGLPDQSVKVPNDYVRWEAMMRIVVALHWRPQTLSTSPLKAGIFEYEMWRLVFNELETPMDAVDTCVM